MMIKRYIAGGAIAMAASLLMALEGFSPTPYYDSAGVMTDCYGETQNVDPNKVSTKAECLAKLDARTLEYAQHVDKELEVEVPITMFAAFTSFAYNVGKSAFSNSTLLRLANKGEFRAACDQLHRWVYATKAGIKFRVSGLVNRRNKEHRLCVAEL